LPVSSEAMSAVALKALASKEAGPPLPRLDAAALHALMGATDTKITLPDRNPNR
jgi:hypothetical protein